MVATKILNKIHEIEPLVSECNDLATGSECFLSFNLIEQSLIWWKHFRQHDELAFGQLRGRNFYGVQSSVNEFHLVIAEENGNICGVVPLVSMTVKLGGGEGTVRILSFASDSVLCAYCDFLVSPTNRHPIINELFQTILDLTLREHDILFLGYIPDNSPNLPYLRDFLAKCLNAGWQGGFVPNRRRGGVQPWTIGAITNHCKNLLIKLNPSQPELAELTSDLINFKKAKLLFPKTRVVLQKKIESVLGFLPDEDDVRREKDAILEQLAPALIKYPYIKLPKNRETYLSSLSKETRRYFRRYGKRFKESGGFFEKILPEKITNEDLDDYLNLHSQKWQDDSAAVNKSTIEFHRELGMTMARSGHFCLFFAKIDGRRIAAHSCFDLNGRREGYFTGRDPSRDELRAGRLLYMETILDAIEQGFSIYDLGYGGDAYKMSFTDTFSAVNNLILAPGEKMPTLQKVFPKYEYIDLD